MAAHKPAHNVWKEETYIDLVNGKSARIVTTKRSTGALTSSITVGESKPADATHCIFTHAPFSDFSKQLISKVHSRTTKQLTESQHLEAVNLFKTLSIENDIIEFYKMKS